MTEILVHVSGTNRLGSGLLSTPVSVSGTSEVYTKFMCILMELTAFSFSCLYLTLNPTGVTNQFVDLSFDPASKLAIYLFFFLNWPKSANEMTCSIVYGVPGERCMMFSRQSSKSSSDKVYLGFPEANHLQSQEEYCRFPLQAMELSLF